MTDEEGFLQAIIESPDDDAPRLVFADWLEERGDPRGEFIRVQCEQARMSEDDGQWPIRVRREEELLNLHGPAWLGGVSGLVTDCRFARGFVESATMGARQFLTHADKLFRLAPIRHLRLTRLGSSKVSARDIANCPVLGRLRRLDIVGLLGDAPIQTLLRSPFLVDLRELDLSGTELGRACLETMRASSLRSLELLDLSDNSNWCQGLDILAGDDLPFTLRTLHLVRANVDTRGVETLAQGPGLTQMNDLNLKENRIRVAGAQAIARSRVLTQLTTLNLRGCVIGVGGTQALAASSNVRKLRGLDLQGNNLGNNGLRAILTSPYLTDLTELHLGSNQLTTPGIEDLAAWPGLARLRVLNLYNNPAIGEAGVRALAGSPHVRNLRELDLAHCNLDVEAAEVLIASPYLDRLRYLLVGGNRLGAKAGALRERFPIVG